jgi:hypothetical protein
VETKNTRFIDTVVGATVVAGSTTNYELSLGSNATVVTGSLTDRISLQPILTGSIVFYDSTGAMLGSAHPSDGDVAHAVPADGTYIFGGLDTTAVYYARTDATAWVDELWNGITCFAGDCVVTSGTPIDTSLSTVVDFQLYPIEVFADGFD